MIGKKQLEISASQFVAGMATTDYTQDGGFGNSSVNINLLTTPGVVRPMAAEVNVSTNVTENMVASAEDSQTVVVYDRLFIGDAAGFYTLTGTTLTKRSTGAKSYVLATTDMVAFAGNTYVTSTTDVAKWNTGSLTLTESYWVTTSGKTPLTASNRHPMLTFENFLWIADGNLLHNIDSSGTISTSVLVLNPNDFIEALSIDPATGLMLISVNTLVNASDALNGKSIVYLYDGYSPKPRRKVFVDDMITAFYPLGGQVYVGYGTRLGFWNGNGVTFLRSLENVTYTVQFLAYKHHFSNIGNTLLVANNKNVLAYGEISQGAQKVFWYPYQQVNSSDGINLLCNVGNTRLYIARVAGSAAAYLSYIDFTATTAPGSGANFFSNNINFPRPMQIARIRVITTGITTTGGLGGVSWFDENSIQHFNTPTQFVVLSTNSPQYTFDFEYGESAVAQTVQFKQLWENQNYGLVRIIIYYNQYE